MFIFNQVCKCKDTRPPCSYTPLFYISKKNTLSPAFYNSTYISLSLSTLFVKYETILGNTSFSVKILELIQTPIDQLNNLTISTFGQRVEGSFVNCLNSIMKRTDLCFSGKKKKRKEISSVFFRKCLITFQVQSCLKRQDLFF